MTEAAERLIAQLYSQSKLTMSRRENRKCSVRGSNFSREYYSQNRRIIIPRVRLSFSVEAKRSEKKAKKVSLPSEKI
jgi:hypothetical protein